MDYGKIAEIRDKLGEEELLTQLAEEAAELAQAALKLRRAISGKNLTPKGVGECRKALSEELTDVHLCALVVQADPSLQVMNEKVERWYKRLNGTENVVLTREMEERNEKNKAENRTGI